MIDNKSKDDVNTTARSTEVINLYDTARENYIRIVDELTKAQPQYTQSISNLQLDYVGSSQEYYPEYGYSSKAFRNKRERSNSNTTIH